ncbi:MAG: oligosaccharide flippase family protein [Candidatus Limnocylindria bacterium]
MDRAGTQPRLPDAADGEAPRPSLAGREEDVQRSLISDAAMYTVATYAAQVLIFVALIVQRRLLGPTATGYWALMATAWSFFSLAALGVVDGAVRQIPHYRGRDDLRSAAATADTAFSFSQVVTTGTGVAVMCVALIAGDGWAPELRWGLVLVGLTAPLRNLVDCHEMLFQATKRFLPLSAGLIVKALVMLTLQTLAVYLFGFYGMFVGLVALNVGALILWRRLRVSGPRNLAFRRSITRARLRELIRIGIPLYVFGHAWILFFAIDSLIVAGFVGIQELGYYALAVSVTTFIILLPKGIGQALFPRMQERYSASGDVRAASQPAADTQLVLAFLLVPLFIAAAYFLLPVLIRHVLPAFAPAIGVVHIMVAGTFLIALVEMPVQLIITIGKRWNLSVLMLGGLAVNAGANYVAVGVLDEGIEGAAYATVLSYLVLLVAVSCYGFATTGGWGFALRQLGAIAAVLAWTLGAIWGLEELIGAGGGSLAGDLALNLAKLAALCLLLAPWLFVVERRYGALSTIRDTLVSFQRTARARLRQRGGDAAT